MAELLQITGTQNPGAPGTLRFGREGSATGFTTDSEGNVTCTALTVGGVPVTGSGGVDPPYPPAGYGLIAYSIDPMLAQVTSAIPSNELWYTRLWIPANKAITNLWYAVRTAGTWDGITTPNQIGLYDDTGTLLGATADDGTLWTATGWRGGPVVGGPIAAQNSGRFVYLVSLDRGMTNLSLAFVPGPTDLAAPYASTGVGTATNRRAAYAAGTALPASFNPATVGTSSGFLALAGVS